MELELSQTEIDDKNKSFWSELCGTQLAKSLGVTGSDTASLERFDNFYFDFYPYLKEYLFLEEIAGKNVLEVGLGYGTVSQLLAQFGANYHGLDIAENACKMAEHRLQQNGLKGETRNESMLACSYQDNYFDNVISIGCFHHTGNLQECINQTYRVLKPGGKATVMVYNKFSLRQWVLWPGNTTKNLFSQILQTNKKYITETQRKAYDVSISDEAAPETEFFSVNEIREIFSKFSNLSINKENFDHCFAIKLANIPIYRFRERSAMLKSFWARNFGLDLYIQVQKPV